MIETTSCDNIPNLDPFYEPKSSNKCRSRIPRRYLIAFLGFFGFLHVYLLRVNMSFAIVAMTSNNSRIDSNGTTYYHQDFDWDSKERGVVLSSFFYGYLVTQIFGGYLAPIVGGGRLLYSSILATSLLALATPPIVIFGGFYPLVIVRILQGLFQGVVFPSMHELLSHWAPPLERTKLMGIIYSGGSSGTFITMAICGIIAEQIGWMWMFYIFGGTGILWSVAWTWQVYESPSMDPNITTKEKEYIITSIGTVKRNKRKFSDVPWRMIFNSMPIWAAIVAHTTQNSGFYTLLTQLPSFLKDVSGLSFDKMGLLAAVPYLFMAIVVQCQGQLADLLRTRFKIKTTTVRKVFTSGCYLVQIIFLLLTSQMTHSPAAAITCLTIAVSSGGFVAYSVNYLDLAPQYSSLIFGISNTIATIPGMLSPTITGYIVQNKLPSEWMTVFYIVSAVYVFGAIFYATFASGELQSWAKSEPQEKMPAN